MMIMTVLVYISDNKTPLFFFDILVYIIYIIGSCIYNDQGTYSILMTLQ